MPILDISFQVVLFFIAIASGFIMGGVYDIVRIFRRIIHHPPIFMFMEDAVYWISAIGVVFYIMLVMTQGEIRFFAIGGFFIGMFLYFCTISKLIIRSAEFIIKILKAILNKILCIITFPFKILYKLLYKLMYPFNAIFTKFINNVKKDLKKYISCGKILLRKLMHINKDKNMNDKI